MIQMAKMNHYRLVINKKGVDHAIDAYMDAMSINNLRIRLIKSFFSTPKLRKEFFNVGVAQINKDGSETWKGILTSHWNYDLHPMYRKYLWRAKSNKSYTVNPKNGTIQGVRE